MAGVRALRHACHRPAAVLTIAVGQLHSELPRRINCPAPLLSVLRLRQTDCKRAALAFNAVDLNGPTLVIDKPSHAGQSDTLARNVRRVGAAPVAVEHIGEIGGWNAYPIFLDPEDRPGSAVDLHSR